MVRLIYKPVEGLNTDLCVVGDSALVCFSGVDRVA